MTPHPLPPGPPDPDERGFERLEAALRREPLLPLPIGLDARIVARTRERRISTMGALARLAAAVLVGLSTWLAWAGEAPAVADVAPADPLQHVLPVIGVRESLAAAPAEWSATVVPASEGGSTALLAVGGLALIGAGVFLARRVPRVPSAGGSDAP